MFGGPGPCPRERPLRGRGETPEPGDDLTGALIVSYGAIGRAEAAHGPSAGDCDITRGSPNRHISSGHGLQRPPGWGNGLSRRTPVRRRALSR
jgi:hypothetical protein